MTNITGFRFDKQDRKDKRAAFGSHILGVIPQMEVLCLGLAQLMAKFLLQSNLNWQIHHPKYFFIDLAEDTVLALDYIHILADRQRCFNVHLTSITSIQL